MKTFNTILLALLCLCFSCKQTEPAKQQHTAAADSAEIATKAAQLAQQMVQRAKDSMAIAQAVKPLKVKSYGPCPAKVKKCLIANNGGSKAIVVTVKNTSNKKIDMIGVAWVVYNKKHQRLGSSSGKAKKVLPGGGSASYSWGINAEIGTNATASVYSIHYHDGSVWLAGEEM